jgi:benzoate/toluate 1,2-dioxygenase subunit alpha
MWWSERGVFAHMIMNAQETHDWDTLVQEDRVHRSVYTDPALFELEIKRIFEKTWIYVGHESQVPNAGDYFSTWIGRKPVLMVRKKDGEIGVFYNRCSHKGTQLVTERQGNVKAFRCLYHGWCYRTDGKLLSIPLEDGYEATRFSRKSPEAGIQAVPRADDYRGFVFASLSDEGPELSTWLKGVDSSLDNMVDRSPEGELEVTGGVLRYEINANWKFHVENLNDLLHAIVTHQSASRTARNVGARRYSADATPPEAIQILAPFSNRLSFFDEMGVTAFDNGHSYSGGNISIHSAYSDIPDYQAQLEAAYGAQRTQEILSVNRHNTIVYPSLTLKGAIQTIRVVRPLAIDRSLLESWTFRLKGAPDELLRRSVLYSTLINSSAGLIQPDDHDAYIRMQRGLLCGGNEWVSMHRHLGRDEPAHDNGRSAVGSSDIVFRNQFRTWKSFMMAEDG